MDTGFIELFQIVSMLLWYAIKIMAVSLWEFLCDIPTGIKLFALFLAISSIVFKYAEKKYNSYTSAKRLTQELGEAFLGGINLETSMERTNCRVCGEAFGEIPIVACRLCGTIHHEDCWDYTGQCSIYGCGATRSIKKEPTNTSR